MISWIQTWLTDRRQRVTVDGEISACRPVVSGVSQVSVFVLFVNYLEDALSSKVLTFADDTNVFITVKTDKDKDTLQYYLTKLVKLSEKRMMLFIFGKWKWIHIGHGNVNKEYVMGDAMLSSVKKDLTVTVSVDMTFPKEVELLLQKAKTYWG